MKLKLTKKVMQWGCSLGVIIDKVILQKLKIKKGDLIQIEVEKVK